MATISSSYTPQASGEVVVRENLIVNPGPATLDGWAGIGADMAIVAGHLKATVTTESITNTIPRVQVVTDNSATTVTAGDPYYLRAEVKHSRGLMMGMRTWFMTADGTYVGYHISEFILDTSDWVPVEITNTVPETAELMGYQFIVNSAAAASVIGDTFEVRNITTDPGTYFDENTPASGDFTYRARPGGGAQEVLTLYDSVTETTPRLVLGYQSRREARTIVHRVLDRTDPDVSLRAAGLRTGQLNLFYLTEQGAYDAEVMHTMPGKFTFTEDDRPTAAMTYVVADGNIDRSLDDGTRTRWVVSIPYAEVAS